jgi:hypothetical protein
MRVYLLTDYEEHGAVDVVGTTDRVMLAGMITQFSDCGPWLQDAVKDLEQALSEEVTGKWKLGRGWGGVNLHILDID